MIVTKIRCCGCNKRRVEARLTNGAEIYPHRKDLHSLPFWKCDDCGNFVGCHHKNKKNKIQPLGCIPTPEIKKKRQKIHLVLDPIWQSGKMKRQEIYNLISEHLGYRYHTATTRSVEECDRVLDYLDSLVGGL